MLEPLSRHIRQAANRRRWKKLFDKFYPELRISGRDSRMVISYFDDWIVADSIDYQDEYTWCVSIKPAEFEGIARDNDASEPDTSKRAIQLIATAMVTGLLKKETDR